MRYEIKFIKSDPIEILDGISHEKIYEKDSRYPGSTISWNRHKDLKTNKVHWYHLTLLSPLKCNTEISIKLENAYQKFKREDKLKRIFDET